MSCKEASVVDLGEFDERERNRGGLRELDEMTEALPGLTRQQRDRERFTPRSTTDDLRHPMMQRRLPDAAAMRMPLSSRQKKARSKARYETLRTMPRTQYEAQRRIAIDPQEWGRINDQLSDGAGDVQSLSDRDRAFVGQVDRSIQSAERRNDRGHVVYANVGMPSAINRSNIDEWVDTELPAGTRVSFDRYTMGSHQLHETAAARPDPGGRVAVCEIQTRLGAYLGHSDSQDDTSHLLPRGMELEVVGSHQATYVTPDGQAGSRLVIQMRDVTPDPATRG